MEYTHPLEKVSSGEDYLDIPAYLREDEEVEDPQYTDQEDHRFDHLPDPTPHQGTYGRSW